MNNEDRASDFSSKSLALSLSIIYIMRIKIPSLLSGVMIGVIPLSAHPEPQSKQKSTPPSLALRQSDGTVVIEFDDNTIKITPGTLQISANDIAYKGSKYAPFSKTILTQNVKLSTVGEHVPCLRLRCNHLTVNTEFTEWQIEVGEYMEGIPLFALREALVKAPYTPRFRLLWSQSGMSGRVASTLVYDRRAKTLAFFNYVSETEKKSYGEKKLETGITDEVIKQRTL